MSKYLLPLNNPLLHNKNNISGGKNSTAKPVSTNTLKKIQIPEVKSTSKTVLVDVAKELKQKKTEPIKPIPTTPTTQLPNNSLIKSNTFVTAPNVVTAPALPPLKDVLAMNPLERIELNPFVKQAKDSLNTANKLFEANKTSATHAQAVKDAEDDLSYAVLFARGKTHTLDDIYIPTNTQVEVTTVTSSNLRLIERAQNTGTLQVVYLVDDEDYLCTSKTGYGAQVISSHYLNGIKKEDTVVMWDSVSQKFYRFDTDTSESLKVREQKESIAEQQQELYNQLNADVYEQVRRSTKLVSELTPYIERIQNGTATEADYTAYNKLYTEYKNITITNEYTSNVDTYNSIIDQMNELQTQYDTLDETYKQFGFSDIIANKAWKNQMSEYTAKIKKAKKEYEETSKYFSDYSSATQINSASDAVRLWWAGITSDEVAYNSLLLGLGKVFDQTINKPFEYMAKALEWNTPMTQEERGQYINDGLKMLLNNTLVNVGETVDMVNIFKPTIAGQNMYDRELAKEYGFQQYYDAVQQLPIEQLPALDTKQAMMYQTEEERIEARRSMAYGQMLHNAYWGAYGTTPSIEYDMMWSEDEQNFGTFLATMALDIFLDPTTYITFGTSKLAKAGTMVDDVADLSKNMLRTAGYVGDLSDDTMQKLATNVVKQSIMDGVPLTKTYTQQMATFLSSDMADGVKIKHLFNNLPNKNVYESVAKRLDAVHYDMLRFGAYADSLTPAYATARINDNKLLFNVLKQTSDDALLKTSLGKSYDMVGRMTNVKRSLDFIDHVGFNLAVPVKPVADLARYIKATIQTADAALHASTFLGRIRSKVSKLADANGEIPLGKSDEFMEVVTKELRVFDIDTYNNISNEAHRIIRTYNVESQLQQLQDILDIYELVDTIDVDKTLEMLTNAVKRMGTEQVPLNTVEDFMAYLKKPLGSENHTIYEMLDAPTISKLRKFASDYNALLYKQTAIPVEKLLNDLTNWRSTINKGIAEIVARTKNTDTVLDQLTDDYGQIIKMLDSSRNLHIEGITKITKQELNESIRDAQQAICDLFDGALDGDITKAHAELNKALDRVQTLFTKCAEDVRNAYAQKLLYTMDTKVERLAFGKAGAPLEQRVVFDELISGFTKAYNARLGVQATQAQITEAFLDGVAKLANKDGHIDISELDRVWTGMLEKSARAAEYTADSGLFNCAQPFLSNRSAVSTFVQHGGVYKEYATLADALKTLKADVATYAITCGVYARVNNLDLPSAYKAGVLDAIAGEQQYINSVFKNIDVYNSNAVAGAIDNITNHIVDKSAQFIANKSHDNVKLFSTILDGKRVRMCTLDTAVNVSMMKNSLDSIPDATKYLSEDADEYLDIYYSLSKTNENGNPYMISFQCGDELITFRNANTLFNPDANYIRTHHGINMEHASGEYSSIIKGYAGLNKFDFENAICDKLVEYKHLASESNKRIRFIGYNNGSMGTRQDRALSRFIQKSAVPVHNDLTVDLADFLRSAQGIPIITTSTRGKIKELVRHTVHSGLAQETNSILSKFDVDLFASAEELSTELQKQYDTLVSHMPAEYITSIINSVENLKNAVVHVHARTASKVEQFQDICINERALLDLFEKLKPGAHLTGINIHALLEEAMQYAGKDFTLNTMKIVDRATYEYLFNLEALSKHLTAKEVMGIRNTANAMMRNINNIRQPELIAQVGIDAYKEALMRILGEVDAKTLRQSTDGMLFLKVFKHDNNNVFAMYSACKYIKDHYEVDIADMFKKFKDNNTVLTRSVSMALESVQLADELIENSTAGVFTTMHRTGHSKIYGTLTAHSQLLNDMRNLRAYSNNVTDFNTYAQLKTALYQGDNVVSAHEQIAAELFSSHAKHYEQYVNSVIPTSFTTTLENYDGLAKTLKDTAKVSKTASRAKNITRIMGDLHRESALCTVFSLDDKEFFTYLVKDCKNNLIVDLNSTYMQDIQTKRFVIQRIVELQKGKMFNVELGTDGIVKIYYDVTKYANSNMDELFSKVVDAHVDYFKKYTARREEVYKTALKNYVQEQVARGEVADVAENYFKSQYEKYTKLEDGLAPNMPNHWIVSTYNVNTQETAENLQAVFPENARFNLNDMNQYGMFDESFTCSVWADSSVIREHDFIKYYSDDVIKSIGNGLYQVRNNLEAIKNKFALYGDSRLSLNYIAKHTQIRFDDYVDFNKTLEYNGLVLHRGYQKVNGKMVIQKIDVTSNAHLAQLLKDSRVIVTPIDVYSEMVQFAKGNNRAIKLSKYDSDANAVLGLLRHAMQVERTMRMTGYLFTSVGTAFRNVPDSFLKAANAVNGDVFTFARYYNQAGEVLKRYEDVYAKVKQYYPGGGNFDDIVRFFNEHADETNGMTLDLMRAVFAHRSSASSGGLLASVMDLQVSANFQKLRGLCADMPEITDEMLSDAIKIYQKEANKASIEPNKNFIKHKQNVHAALKAKGFDGKVLDKLTELYYSHTPSTSAVNEWIRNSPGILARLGSTPMPDASTLNKVSMRKSTLSNWVTFNANLFSAAEDRARLGMFLYFTDEMGYSTGRASAEVIKTQFDYSARTPLLESIERLFPFSTFKVSNMAYWLKEAPKHFNVIRSIEKLTRATEVHYDTEEIMNLTRGILIREKIASGEIILEEDGSIDVEASPDGIWSALAQAIIGEDGHIETYMGQLRMQAELSGGIPLGQHHVLKIGNTFVEALTFANALTTAIPQILSGSVPDVLSDSVYAPIGTMLSALHTHTKQGFNKEATVQWVQDNWYDVVDFIPFYGAIANRVINNLKNGRLNMQDIWAIITNPQLKEEYMHTVAEKFYCVTGSVFPSVVGTVYDDSYWDRPIGYNWYDQDEEYRDTHRFVFGVSYVPTFFAKNPATYVDYMAMYMLMGYTKEETLEILEALFGKDSSGAPVKWAFNQKLFDSTLQYLLDRGYEMSEALEVLMNADMWDTSDLAIKLGAVKQEEALQNSVFYKMYDMLPDYIKYTDGQFTALRKHYKEQCYNEAQTWTLMWQGAGFIDPTGAYKVLTPEQVIAMSNEINSVYYEYMEGLPDWYKYEEGAATRAVQYLKNNFGMTTQQARDYIIKNNFYVTVDGKVEHFTEEESKARTKKNQEDFYAYYDTLPKYMRYEKGAYARTLKHLVNEMGISEENAKKMIQNGVYLTLDGELINCANLVRTSQYNKVVSNNYKSTYYRYVPRPKRVKKRYIKQARARRPYKMRGNNSMTYSLVNVRNGSNYGTRNAYKVTLGYNSASSILSTKGNYPQTWRNIAQAYRRNMYKEHYAKYGMSRIDMRSGVWKGYSNASVTRLRRENLYAARRYRNRRVF